MQTNPNHHLSEMLAYVAMIACVLIVAYIMLGHPGIEAPELAP
jgi:hypothetical protein